MVADNREAVDGVLVPICCQATLLNWLRPVFAFSGSGDRFFLGSDVPLQEVARHGGANNDVGVVRIEHGLGDFVLAVQREFGAALKTHTKDVDQAVWFIHVPLATLAVTGKEDFRLRGGPVNRGDCPVRVNFVLEDEFFVQLAAPLEPFVVFAFVLLGEEFIHEVELLAKCAFDHARTVIEKAHEVGLLHYLLSFVLGHLHHFHFLKVFLFLALGTQFFFLPVFNELAIATRG